MQILKTRTSHKDNTILIVLSKVNRVDANYATHISNKAYGGYNAGHYFETLEEAERDFYNRT